MNELLIQSEYAEIIIELLKEPYSINSVAKIVFLSFCIKNEKKTSYRKQKTDFVDVLLNNIEIKMLTHQNELLCIFEVLNKLKRCGWIETEAGRITVLKDLSLFKCDHKFLIAYKEKDINPVVEVNKLDDKAFMEEVLRHV